MRSDVCLILEGTYPYVAGGVSTWVAQILEAMPQIHFSIVYIGPRSDMPREYKYAIPNNVLEIREVFVHDYPQIDPHVGQWKSVPEEDWRILADFEANLLQGDAVDLEAILPVLKRFASTTDFLQALGHSREAWEVVLDHYRRFAPPRASFIDFFWSHRFINLPALNLLRASLPQARVYHTACTGYAGLLGAKAKLLYGAPLLVTEHGIYTRERRIEIFNADWIRDEASAMTSLDLRRAKNFYKEWWIQFFLALSRTAYREATQIFSLFEANRQAQIADGADASRIQIIPNGIDTTRYGTVAQRQRTAGEPLHVGFIGRITAIKDIKTLLRALEILGRRVPVEAFLMGPMDEEEEYAAECHELAQVLGIEERTRFLGRVNIKDYLGQLDVVVLTSISEGLPFVILEANCAGLPVVTTEVGACRELLQGRTAEDRELGESGLLAPVASPAAIAAQLEILARNPELARRMGMAGRERVHRYYDLHEVMQEYQRAYERHFFAGGRVRLSQRKYRDKSRRGAARTTRQRS